jgi:hypothetical protein
MSKERDVASICARLAELEAERSELNEQLVRLEAKRGQEKVGSSSDSPVTANSTAAEKIALFRRLFAGRPGAPSRGPQVPSLAARLPS